MPDTNTVTQLPPDLLRTFVAAANSGSFTHAAEAVHRTQSAVSMQMKRLESELDRQLFLREGRGVILTPDGDILYRYARRLLTLHDETLAAVSGPKTSGKVRFGAPEDYAAQYLPCVLKQFAAELPDVEVDVFCDASPTLRDRFANKELDVIITTEENGNGPNCRRVELAWIMAEHGGPLHMKPLPLALFHSGCLYRRNTLLALEEAGMEYRVAYGSPSLAGVLAAVRAGLAVAPVSRGSVTPGCRQATRQDGLPPIAPVGIGLHKQEQCDEAATSFHAFMLDALDTMPG